MNSIEVLFWIGIFIVFYSYIGYGILLYILVKIKKAFSKDPIFDTNYEPNVTLVVHCFNEAY